MRYGDSYIIVKHGAHDFWLRKFRDTYKFSEHKHEAELFVDEENAIRALKTLYKNPPTCKDGKKARIPSQVVLITLTLSESEEEYFRYEPRLFIPEDEGSARGGILNRK